MDSEEELIDSKVNRRHPRKLPKLPKPQPRPRPRPRAAPRRKVNQISSSGDESLSNSGRSGPSEHTSIEMDVFMVRSKPPRSPPLQKQTTMLSDDEISNQHTSDDLPTPTSDDTNNTYTKSQEVPEYVRQSSSDSKSYRDKLKERFRSVKQLSTKHLEKNSLKKFKSKSRDVVNLNKCIENLRQDNLNVNSQIKAHRPYVYQGESGEASSAEKYQFFCESLPETNSRQDYNDEEDTDKVDTSIDQVVEVKRPENMKNLLVKSYEEYLWSSKSGNLTANFEDTHEDEVISSDKEPNLPRRHLSQLKQRLIASENKEFFDAAGNVKYNKSNYSRICYRPDRFDLESPFELINPKPSTTIPTSMSSIVVESKPTLEINIQGFRFTHHPLFTPEHVHQEELIRLIDVHKEFRRTRKREDLWERLQSLRKTQMKLSVDQNAAGDAKQDMQVENIKLIKEIREHREEFYKECKSYRDNAKSVLSAWKSLKNLRKSNKYSTTTIKLIIGKHEGFYDDPERVLQEMSAEKEVEYKEKLIVYKEELQEWRKQVEDDDAIEEEKPVKPPRLISAKKLRVDVARIILECFGDEDEPSVSFTVNYSHETSPDETVTEEETTRRSAVTNTKVRLKLFLNSIPICKSKICKLTSSFTLNFDEVLSLRLMEHENRPEGQEKIEVRLVEVAKVSTRELCTGHIEIPSFKLLNGQSNFQEVYFQNSNENAQELSGFLTYCIAWDAPRSPKPKGQSKPERPLKIDKNTTKTKQIDFDQIPKPTGKYFRCDPCLESFTICSREEIENNIRLQLLKLRDNNEPEFVGMMVPNRLKEIPSNIFATYKRRLAEEKYQEYFEQEDGIEEDVVGKRSLGRKYLRQIHTKVFQICRNCENNLCFEDVVDEKMVPWIQNYLKSMLSNFFNWFKLQPASSKPMPTLSLRSEEDTEDFHRGATSCKVMIHLKAGINLPTPTDIANERKQSAGKKKRNKTPEEGKSGKSIQEGQYYVEICHDTKKVTSGLSSLAQGKPSWNETLSITLQSENVDYLNPNSLSGSIHVHLFQQLEHIEDHNKITSAYLGSVEIPISSAVSEKLEGEFPLNTPPFIYGYEKEEEARTPSTPRIQQSRNLSFLEMSVFADSTIPKITADLSAITSGEPPFIRDHVLEWNKRFNADHPRRKFSALAIDSNGKTICLTRFIKPLEPPKLNADEFDVSLEQCARFVSLIPFSKVNKFYENVWLTAEQVLKLGIGSLFDHATLLTCYLLSLKIEVWLLLGFGIPCGNTAYVLLREHNETPIPNHFIIDVATGSKFNVTDQYCPLQKVYCVLNEHNIWANVQRGDAVFTTRFDFTRRFDWQALFNNTVSSPSNSVQQHLHYLQAGDAPKLQNAIEKRLTKQIAKLRTQDVTIWNHYVSSLLKTQMHRAETNFMHSKTHLESTSQIIEYSNNFHINGTIQCLRFSSVHEVVDEVLRTQTWEVHDANVEFAACVHAHAYVNHVIAVWIAFASIVKK